MNTELITTDSAVALQFIVDFAQRDIDALKPKELLSLLRNLHAFIHRDNPTRYSSLYEMARELQSRALGLLQTIAQDGKFAIAGDLQISFWAIRSSEGVKMFPMGHPLYLMLYQMIQVLKAAGADKVRRCESVNRGEVCGRLFFKVTAKEHCSTRCQSRAYMQWLRDPNRTEDKKPRKTHGKTARSRGR